MKIVIVDYGMGNIRSIVSTFKYLGVNNIIVSDRHDDIRSADKLLLPGVGSFAKAMSNIRARDIDKYLNEEVIEKKKPILGICLGAQLLCNGSEEDGGSVGLGYIDVECEKFKVSDVIVPHVGFNQISVNNVSKLYYDFDLIADFYFTHSFKLQNKGNIKQSVCNYGGDFIASYESDNIVGTQFHPELSQTNGLRLLKNFIEKF
ncbi:imidazole glycerol phosphate synthase subunit HisH 1 [Francisella halioticida]|uniref:Imidazole glycerol phosphate synthase subunit HisH n=1 Tax=Francisella halioticida TaxID=549298 RepID=A0ABM6M0R8_9GAMM|nr:imidazole glycerol phosphate synthase subunit HisH [Francisella halioticida]ASG68525.1 imidazole glycerol phosphate synthase subunit HisH [Francisella halioticida]BCD91419.1 imidazole glycerol phosphate synthase subunit HisH 1 [Francisella halioticida]